MSSIINVSNTRINFWKYYLNKFSNINEDEINNIINIFFGNIQQNIINSKFYYNELMMIFHVHNYTLLKKENCDFNQIHVFFNDYTPTTREILFIFADMILKHKLLYTDSSLQYKIDGEFIKKYFLNLLKENGHIKCLFDVNIKSNILDIGLHLSEKVYICDIKCHLFNKFFE